MDPLDSILLEAWSRVSARIQRERIEALKRSQRRFKGVLTRPMREWCLVIRASDTRIITNNNDSNSINSIIDPPGAIERVQEHTLALSGRLLRDLTKPVVIPWPGVTYEQAARICGREYKTMKGWVQRAAGKGHFKIDHYREFKFPEFTKRSKAKGSGGRPYVWTPSPIDPNNFEGRPPHPVWGTLWQWQWDKLPREHVLVVQRAPVLRPYRGALRFRGWHFICPGRVDDRGEGCGRRCTYLYAPQTVWTLAKAIGDGSGIGFDMPEDSGLAGQWFPGMADPILAAAANSGSGSSIAGSFACKTCWGVRSACMANRNGWNEFIAQISGGLLYGRDVPRPPDICPVQRKKRPYKWKRSRREIDEHAAHEAHEAIG